MSSIRPSIENQHGGKVRVRACGLCWDQDRLLMVNMPELYNRPFWAPPGGGLQFGESAREAVCRELLEESGLQVECGELQFVCEYIGGPLHAVELYFSVQAVGGQLHTGSDPEYGGDQLIRETIWMDSDRFSGIPREHFHGVFSDLPNLTSVRRLKGYYRL